MGAGRGWWAVGGVRAGVLAELVARGYRPRSAAAQLALMADVSAWLAARGLAAAI